MPIAWCVPELPPNGAQRITATFQYCQAALWPAGPPHRGAPWFGLSRVKGNFHARFLGGRERVTARAYPTVHARSAKTAFLSVVSMEKIRDAARFWAGNFSGSRRKVERNHTMKPTNHSLSTVGRTSLLLAASVAVVVRQTEVVTTAGQPLATAPCCWQPASQGSCCKRKFLWPPFPPLRRANAFPLTMTGGLR